MALVYAISSGNWSNPARWNTGVLPVAGDVVRPNNFIVTMDVNATVAEIRNDAGGGAVIGGSFTLNDGVTVTASNGFFGTYQNTAGHALLVYAGSNSVTINGNLNGSQINTSLTSCLLIDSSGTVTVNGNLNTINAGPNASGIRITTTGTIILNGNVVHINSGFGIRNNEGNGTVIVNGDISTNSGTAITNTSGTVTITGNITTNAGTAITNTSGTVTITGDIANNSLVGNTGVVQNLGSGTININGTVNGASTTSNNITNITVSNNSIGTININGAIVAGGATVSSGTVTVTVLNNASSGTINVTGSVTGSVVFAGNPNTSNINAIRNISNGVVNIVGNVSGTLSGLAIHAAAINTSIGTINITGNAIGGSTGLAVANTSTGTLTVNGNAIGGTGFQAIEGVNAAGTTLVEKIVFGANGQTATRGYIKFKNTVNIAAETILLTDATTTNLVDINVVPNLQPAISDVRLGVTYSSGSLTGTMNVPPFNAVKAGVPVDNGVGTAALEPQDVWNVLISGLTQSGSIGERLKNVATVETTGTQIASFNV